MLTKATFTAEQWGKLLQLAQIATPYPNKNDKSPYTACKGNSSPTKLVKIAVPSVPSNDVQWYCIGGIW